MPATCAAWITFGDYCPWPALPSLGSVPQPANVFTPSSGCWEIDGENARSTVDYAIWEKSEYLQVRNINPKLSPNKCFCCFCLVTQSCLTLCNPMDCSPPGSSVHGILQARILEWVAIPFSRGSSQRRNWTQSPAWQAVSLLGLWGNPNVTVDD